LGDDWNELLHNSTFVEGWGGEEAEVREGTRARKMS
jgi:hypothetical protein